MTHFHLIALKLILCPGLVPRGKQKKKKRIGATEMKTPCVSTSQEEYSAMSDLTASAVAGYHITF